MENQHRLASLSSRFCIRAFLLLAWYCPLCMAGCNQSLPEKECYPCPCAPGSGLVCVGECCRTVCSETGGCSDGYWCNHATNVCMPNQGIGDGTDLESDGSGTAFQTLSGKGPGQSCAGDAECRIGLQCIASQCTVTGAGDVGDLCILSEDCGAQLVCAFDMDYLDHPKTCVPEGEGQEWEICATDVDCHKGLYCKIISFTGLCTPEGDKEVGGQCQSSDDCKAGLYCGPDGQCGIFGAQIPAYTGAECESSSEIGGPPRVLFEVPRGGQPLKDFYRLPFPNDIRIVDGHLDLTGHPTPGPGIVGFDAVARLIDALETDMTGFGTNPVVFFRLSTKPALSTINGADGDNLFWVDITGPDAGLYGKKVSFSWSATTGRGKYICQNYLKMYVPWQTGLRANRTYAVLITDTLMATAEEDGGNPQKLSKDTDFAAMLSDVAPSDKDLKAAWEQYQGLRNFLNSSEADDLGLNSENVVGAAVFSTYDPTWLASRIREKVAVKAPEIKELVLCESGTVSPCDDGLTGEEHKRGCMSVHPDYAEYQGIVHMPSFQEGVKPFVEPEDGGGIVLDAGDLPITTGYEDVCFSLSVPRNAPMPADGWPVLAYGHGTGGDYRSHVRPEIAGNLSKLKVVDPENEEELRPAAMAVLGWDQVLHGPRIGPVALDPETMVFNFRNPRAVRGNFLQSAAETMFMARMLSDWDAFVPGSLGDPPKLAPGKVFFLGHSQGGISGTISLPFMEEVDFATLSGTGGGLVDSLLLKTCPANVKDGIIAALQDEDMGRTHPVLALLQNYYDPVDPINHGQKLFWEPPIPDHKVYLYHPLGLNDLHTPPKNMKALSGAMQAKLAASQSVITCVENKNKTCDPACNSGQLCLNSACVPVQSGVTCTPSCAGDGVCRDLFESFKGVAMVELPQKVDSLITVEYAPGGEDGHFVIFDNAEANYHLLNFFGTAYLDDKAFIPQIQ